MPTNQPPNSANLNVLRPSVPRIYDYFLGGKDNLEVDRVAGDKLLTTAAEVRPAARRNRAALGRAVRYAVCHGITQILDIGSGLPKTDASDPAMYPLHEQAHWLSTSVRCVYVDNDPIVLAHDRALLDGAIVVEGDLEDRGLLDKPEVQAEIDFGERVVLVLGAILHFIEDDDYAKQLVARMVSYLAPGSMVVISHATADALAPERVAAAESVYENTAVGLCFRSHARIQALFDGLSLTPPGLVYLDDWQPEYAPVPREGAIAAGEARENQIGSTWLKIGAAIVPDPPPDESATVTAKTKSASTGRIFRAYLNGATPAGLPEAERRVFEDVRSVAPEAPQLAVQSRLFRNRAIRELGWGISQFIDLGCGYLQGHQDVHDVAREQVPDARIVYVDNEPEAVAHSREQLHGVPGTTIIDANIREPESVLSRAELRALLDLSQPVTLLMCMVLHCIGDHDDPKDILGRYRDALVPGSVLIISHVTEGEAPEQAREAAAAYHKHRATTKMVLRTRERIHEFFEGWELQEPGLVAPVNWRPDLQGADAVHAWSDLTAPDWVLAGAGVLRSAEP